MFRSRTPFLAPTLLALAAALAPLSACGPTPEAAPPRAPHRDPTPSSTASALTIPSSQPSPSAAIVAPPPPVESDPGRPWNVILISIDSMRADMPWAGYPRAIAPRLTAMYEKSVRYTNGYSVSSGTSKSVPGMLASRYPSEMPRSDQFFTYYGTETKLLGEHLKAAGVVTMAGQAHWYLRRGVTSFDRGFDQWLTVPGIGVDAQTDPHITSQDMTPMAIKLLSNPALSEKPFFAWFHYMDPHDRYLGHKESPKFGNSARDRYDEEVFYTDMWVGRLLDFVEKQSWAPRTALVFTADHGEAFGEKGATRHAFELWEVLVHVPFFFVVPGAKPRAIDKARSHIDLAPTILDLMKLPSGEGMRGKSLRGEIYGVETPEERDVICDLPRDDFNPQRRALIRGGWKLISFDQGARYQLYNLAADPGESRDLFKKEPEKAKEMVTRFKAASADIKDVPRGRFTRGK